MNSDVTHTMDPQIEYYQLPFAYFRCCLLRTLYSYNGQDAAHDGTKVFPDLADGQSRGVLRRTHLHDPPQAGAQVRRPRSGTCRSRRPTSSHAIERGYTVGGPYMGYYDVIQGATDYAVRQKAKTIPGMKALDDNTLQVTADQAGR